MDCIADVGFQAGTKQSYGSQKRDKYKFDLDAVRVPQKYPGKNISKDRMPVSIPVTPLAVFV